MVSLQVFSFCSLQSLCPLIVGLISLILSLPPPQPIKLQRAKKQSTAPVYRSVQRLDLDDEIFDPVGAL